MGPPTATTVRLLITEHIKKQPYDLPARTRVTSINARLNLGKKILLTTKNIKLGHSGDLD